MPLDIDRYAHITSAIQQWDPRVKILSLGFFILVTALLKSLPVAYMSLIVALIILKISNLPLHFVSHSMKWVVMFLLPFFIMLPFSYPGEGVFYVVGFPFTWEGLRLALLIFVKAVAIVLTTHAIFGSSRFDVSMVALQRLKCPKVIVQMILFTYRYIFVFIDEMKRMEKAIRSRGFVMKTDMKTLKTMANFIGTLLIRSFERTTRVYNAMQSKGYQGELHSLITFMSNKKDFAKAFFIAFVAISLLVAEIKGVFHPAVKGWY